ncbi:uncharacterized protein I303_105141 [Kwoniella dejecticola CBS 10117]|uniref:Poly(A) RNA polymerase mitochondrial-like central palm domain-containing protein n=1 Tax=Kwoniella dejecticola CBS 10117 TaxID=1296121 RepID=A0A1A6A3C1_9TREE|nr:uncharacterized protein I303_05414 [Kwoniella dejecticola CBS 10117]OBR84555.1 hypothetical protein I303_05414 [Kwoniella dejecticola CBS 10117]
MFSSIIISPLQPTSLPSPQLISFADDARDVPSLLDIDEYDTPLGPHPDPPENNRQSQSGGHPATATTSTSTSTHDQLAFFPSTPQPIYLSSSEDLDGLFRLRLDPQSPSLPATTTPIRVVSQGKSPTTPISLGGRSHRRRRSSVSSLTSITASCLPSPRRHKQIKTTKTPYPLNFDTSYPPSPVLDTPDLTSGSTVHSLVPSTSHRPPSNQAIILTKPHELKALLECQIQAYPYLEDSLSNTVHKSSKSTHVPQEQLIRLDDFQYSHPDKSSEGSLKESSVNFKYLQSVHPQRKVQKTSLEEIDQYLDTPQEEDDGYLTPIDYKFSSDFASDELDGIEDTPGPASDRDLLEMLNGDSENKSTSLQETDFYQQVQAAAKALKASLISLKSQPTPTVHNVSPYNLLLSSPSPRKNVPRHIAQPSAPDIFQSEIISAWVKTEPTEKSKEFVKTLLSNLTRIINANYGRSGARAEKRFLVDVFGSVSWGGETGNSGDLDLVILDRAQLRGYEPSLWRQSPGAEGPVKNLNNAGRRSVPPQISGLPRCYYTYDLADCLRRAGMREVQPIAAASTPIVKFKDPQGIIECDINMNDLGGWYNSSLILHYCLISPYLLRPMIYILKRWLSAQDLNDASGSKGAATMSSYCLTLMIIAYLQARGCLPNLQKDINVPLITSASDTNNKDVIWVSWSKDQGVPAHVAFDRDPPEGWTSAEPDLTVADAVRGFFRFFSRTPPSPSASEQDKARFDHRKTIISILQGGLANRVLGVGQGRLEDEKLRQELVLQGMNGREVEEAMNLMRDKRIKGEEKMGKGDRGIQPRNWSERRLVVQDPFLWQKNCAGMMSRVGLDRFFDCVDRAHQMLQSKGRAATIEELLFNPSPIPVRMPTPGRGRGFRGSPVSRRGGMNVRTLWNT